MRAELERVAPSAPGTQGIDAELVDLAVTVRRIAARLHPTVVDQVGLVPALRSLAQEVERGSPLRVRLELDEQLPPPAPEPARAAYRIVQEALRNVVRHAKATQAVVRMERQGRHLVFRIRDDGRGFDPTVVPRTGLGLASLRERALIVGGTVDIASRPNEGTAITVRLPA